MGAILSANSKDRALEKILSQDLSWNNFKILGVPYTNILLNQYSKDIKEKLFPLLFIGIFLILISACQTQVKPEEKEKV